MFVLHALAMHGVYSVSMDKYGMRMGRVYAVGFLGILVLVSPTHHPLSPQPSGDLCIAKLVPYKGVIANKDGVHSGFDFVP